MSESAPAPTRLVGETDLGELYEMATVRAGVDEAVVRVRLDVMVGHGLPASLTLAPDEARALAADLQRWAGHAEREGRAS